MLYFRITAQVVVVLSGFGSLYWPQVFPKDVLTIPMRTSQNSMASYSTISQIYPSYTYDVYIVHICAYIWYVYINIYIYSIRIIYISAITSISLFLLLMTSLIILIPQSTYHHILDPKCAPAAAQVAKELLTTGPNKELRGCHSVVQPMLTAGVAPNTCPVHQNALHTGCPMSSNKMDQHNSTYL
jgi:hypothetical protein